MIIKYGCQRIFRIRSSFPLLISFVSISIFAENREPDVWGLAFGVRSAEIPYTTDIDTVNDVVPLIYYDNNEYFFIRGLTGGLRFYQNETLETSFIGRYRFFDIPADFQNEVQGNAFDVGLQLKYKITPQFDVDFEVLDDRKGRAHANIVANYQWSGGDWDLYPSMRLRWKDDDFNNRYYGLDLYEPGSGFDFKVGIDARYQVWSNFYLVGRAAVTSLENDVTTNPVITRDTQSELYFGIALFNDKKKPRNALLKTKPYLRLAHGWATPSNIGEILAGQTQKDPFNNQLTSVFYGIPVSDTLLTLPIQIYVTPGLVYHYSSAVQENFPEYVLALKGYYTVRWPFRWRIGLAEGISYAAEIPYIEKPNSKKKAFGPATCSTTWIFPST